MSAHQALTPNPPCTLILIQRQTATTTSFCEYNSTAHSVIESLFIDWVCWPLHDAAMITGVLSCTPALPHSPNPIPSLPPMHCLLHPLLLGLASPNSILIRYTRPGACSAAQGSVSSSESLVQHAVPSGYVAQSLNFGSGTSTQQAAPSNHYSEVCHVLSNLSAGVMSTGLSNIASDDCCDTSCT